MKRILALLAGLISTLAASAIVVLVGVFTDFEFQSLGLFFIVPAGSIFIAVAAVSGYAFVIKMMNQKKSSIDYVVAAALGFLAAFFIYFLFYKVSYIENEKIIYSLSSAGKIPIETLQLEDGSPLTFLHYMRVSISSRTITFFYHSGSQGLKIPPNPIVGWIDFIIELCGYLVGSLSGLPLIVNTKFCENCRIYYKKKKWLEADIENLETVKQLDEALKNRSNLQEVLTQITKSSGPINMVFEGESCEKCGDGIFRINFNKKKSNGERTDLDDFKQELKMKNNIPDQTDFSLEKVLKEVRAA